MAEGSPAWEAPARAGAGGGVAGGGAGGARTWRAQAEEGAWRVLLQGAAAAAAGEGGGTWAARAYRALALFKLRRFVEAEQVAQEGSDQRAPFVLRWLHAELPAHTGSPADAQERLYGLLGHCRRRSEEDGAGGEVAVGGGAWERRHDFVLYSLVRHHHGRGEFLAALQLLSWLLDRRGRPPAALAMVVRVLLQVGDVQAAGEALRGLETASVDNTAARVEVLRTRALVQFANLQYAEAASSLDAILEERPWDASACNNRAVCQMYSKDIVGAINRLEGSLRQFPHQMLRESLVGNLASLYELSSADAPASKRRLAQWAAEFAPDDFDVGKL